MALEDSLLEHEGFRALPYRDSLGYWTIGIGHLITKLPITYEEACQISRAPWDRAMALAICASDAKEKRMELERALPWITSLPQVKQDALVELAFNLGTVGLLGFRKMMGCCAAGDWAGAVQQLIHRDPPADMSPTPWVTQVGPIRATDLCNRLLES